eukprot:GHVS01022934.1.p1 GENE.GHVS01022934.1~~GHVS01022934.1.p1  ORF type:complete len:2097 (+),score=211.49 GHVS01022934.1:68-6358(+)
MQQASDKPFHGEGNGQGRHPLSGLEDLINLVEYLPEFVKPSLEQETASRVCMIKGYLLNSEKLVGNHGDFMHMIRLISQIEELSTDRWITLDDRLYFATKLWDLMFEPSLSISSQSRVCDCLGGVIVSLGSVYVPPSWMHPNASEFFVSKEKIGGWAESMRWQDLLDIIEGRFKRSYRDDVDTSALRRKAHISSVVRLVSVLRVHLWDGFTMGPALHRRLICRLDLRTIDIFLKFRLLLLFCPSSYCHYLVYTQKLFQWWSLVNGSAVGSWDPMMMTFLFRGLKYGWATGRPLNAFVQPYLQFLFQILIRQFHLPPSRTVSVCSTFHKEMMAGEYTPVLEKQFSLHRKAAKILVLLLEPQDQVSSFASALPPSVLSDLLSPTPPMGPYGPISSSPVPPAARAADTSGHTPFPSVFSFMEAVVGAVFHYTHPSNVGKWSTVLASFISSLVGSYCRRVSRERACEGLVGQWCGRVRPHWQKLLKEKYAGTLIMGAGILVEKEGVKREDECGRWGAVREVEGGGESRWPKGEGRLEELWGKFDGQMETEYLEEINKEEVRGEEMICLRLGRKEDEKIAELLYPLLLQGAYAKQHSVANSFEDALKRICHLLPDIYLEPVVLRLMEMLAAVSESHQTLSSVRLLTQLCPLILKYSPRYLGELLILTLPGIEPADPFKTVQTLTLYSVLFSYIPCADTSDLDLSQVDFRSVIAKYRAAFSLDSTASSSKFLSIYNYPAERREGGKKTPEEEWMEEQRFREVVGERQMASALLADWVMDWFEQIIRLVQNASKPEDRYGSLMSSVDRGTCLILRSCCCTIFSQVSAFSIDRLLQTFRDWILTNIIPDSLKFTNQILLAFTFSAPTVSLSSLLPVLTDRLLEVCSAANVAAAKATAKAKRGKGGDAGGTTVEEEEGVDTSGVDDSKYQIRSNLPEEHALWYLSCIANLIRRTGSALLPYSKQMVWLIEACLRHESKRVCRLGIKMLRRAIEGTCTTYVNDKRSLGPTQWANEEQRAQLLLRWGWPWWLVDESSRIDWHVPSKEEMDFGNQLIDLAMSFSSLLQRGTVPWELAKSSTFALVTRNIMIARILVKAIAGIAPDERASKTDGFPVVSPFENTLGPRMLEWASGLVQSICMQYLGMWVDNDTMAITHHATKVELHGVEEPKLMIKLLKLSDQLLVRHWASPSSSSSASNTSVTSSFSAWLSCTADVHTGSYWQDLPRVWWVNRVIQKFSNRVEARRVRHPFEGPRRVLLIVAAQLSMYHYAEVRKLAQEVLKDACSCHYGARTVLVRLYLDELIAQTKVVGKEEMKAEGEEEDKELRHARLTGIAYSLNAVPMLRRMWGNSEIAGKTIGAICQSYRSAIEKDTVQVRLSSLASSVLSYRVKLPNDEAFQKYIVNDVVKPLLEQLLDPHDHCVHSWRYQLISTCVLVVLNCPPIGECVDRYATWLLKASDSSLVPPHINTLAVFGLMLLFKSYKRRAHELSVGILNEIHSPATLAKLVKTLTIIHHENIRPSASTRFPDSGYQTVVGIIKIDKTWPQTRSPKCSRNLALHNELFCQTYFSFLYHTKQLVENIDSVESSEWFLGAAEAAVSPLAKCLEELTEAPTSEAEPHVAAVEIVGGLLRACRKWNVQDRSRLYEILMPLLVKEFQKADQDRSFDWADGLRFGVHETKDVTPYIPLFNFTLDQNAAMTSSFSDTALVPFGPIDISDTSSFEITKRLRLYESLLAQVFWQHEGYIRACMQAIKQACCHPYKQVREEVARVVYFIESIGDDPSCPPSIIQMKDELRQFVKNKANELVAFVEKDTTAAHARNVENGRPAELCTSETVLYCLLHSFMSQEGNMVVTDAVECMPFILACCKHPELDIARVGNSLADVYCLSSVHADLPAGPQNSPEMLQHLRRHRLVTGLLPAFEQYIANDSWKIRNVIVRLTETLGCYLRMILYRSNEYSRLVDICITALEDQQTEVRLSAKQALSSLFMTCNDDECKHYTEVFKRLAGPPNPKVGQESSASAKLAGVFGLGALVLAHPYSVPEWLPETVTSLGSYGNAKMPDNIRREVEKCLQEFYRTHQDAWQQLHVRKFSECQLDVLETYKGRPIYFA